MAAMKPWACHVGESAILLRFGTCIDNEISKGMLTCLTRIDGAPKLDGVGELLPTYASILVNFDPLKLSSAQVEQWFRDAIFSAASDCEPITYEPRHVSIPVRYGGEGGPDIVEIARLTGMSSADEVARSHYEGEYRVYFLGFLGGFPYLGGLRPPLTSVPRLATPRQKVPRGTVGIAGGQTGVYPVSSPGGWHCLGRTAMSLFDPLKDPPALLKAGDVVKFVPSEDAIPEESSDERPCDLLVSTNPWVEVLSPGPMTTVQDVGRYGYGRHGVSRSGAADELALRMGNALLGNDSTASGLEVLLGGMKLRCIDACAIALTGADCSATLKRSMQAQKVEKSQICVNEVVFLQRDDELELSFAKDGMRAYVCVQGGVDVPVLLGSRSTDVRTGLGGFYGRSIQKGDTLGRLAADEPAPVYSVHDPMRSGSSGVHHGARKWLLRVVPGPGDPSKEHGSSDEASKELEALINAEFNVMPRSDRMAVCLTPADAVFGTGSSPNNKLVGGQQMSEACVSGTIQLPPDGNPVILLAEHQTTGGYRVPAIVIKADLWQVGQMRPGDRIRFAQTSLDDAVTALRKLRVQACETLPTQSRYPALPIKFKPTPRNGLTLKRIDLNADAGEGFDDAGLLEYVTSVNIACGGHVGTPESIARTVALAAKAGAGIGAHPSFVDKEGFGRVALDTSPDELRNQILWQVNALDGICRGFGRRVQYIKPHGALYHVVLAGGLQGRAVYEAAQLLQLPLLLMPKSPVATFGEGFAERAYDGDSLRPRDKPGAVIHDPHEAAQQAISLAACPSIHSICVHGDSPNAVTVAKAVRTALDKEFQVSPFTDPSRADRMTSDESGTDAQTILDMVSSRASRARKFQSRKVAPSDAPQTDIQSILEEQVSAVVVNGYRTGEGVEPELYPVSRVCQAVESLMTTLRGEMPAETVFSKFARGETSYDEYIRDLRAQLAKQGGGWVTVAPRDTVQQGNDSESASITRLSCMNTEVWAVKAGCVGYEIGGAQFQAGLIRGFDPGIILTLGLPCNMPAHSLQRSQYVNGLTELTPDIRQALFHATAEVVSGHYRSGLTAKQTVVPWHPYNFHAGNFYDEATGRSPQDETTAELLKAGCCPMPVWVFSAKFTIELLRKWTERQIDLFTKAGRTLHCVRIKNPGQGKDWTSEAVWTHAKTMIAVFKSKGMDPPIIYVHNHDFNGMGAHVGAQVFRLAQAEGFNNMIIDAAYRKNGTHNDNTVLLAALKLTGEQQQALLEWNHNQQQIENILCRFDSRNSQMTPWDSDWAGGTEGSDIRIAKEFALDVRKINSAKEVASEVFPLERAVTPFSEYKLRLGIAIMIEARIQPKTAAAVRAWVNEGGKLKVGGDVLVGLKRWETLVPKTAEVDRLLANMSDELEIALAKKSELIRPGDLPEHFTAAQRHIALGYQAKGLEFVTQRQRQGTDLSPLLLAPHVLHREPKTLSPGTEFYLLRNSSESLDTALIVFVGFGVTPSGDLTLNFVHDGVTTTVTMTPIAEVAAGGPGKANANNTNAFGSDLPGELICYAVKEGDVLVEGSPLCTLESMKMDIVVSVPVEIAGRIVKSLVAKPRTKTSQGDKLSAGDLLLELTPAN
jgi:KipI family sensor histidine kinase inhibitor